MRYFLVIFLFCISVQANEIEFGTFYETNTFYSSGSPEAANAFYIKPVYEVAKKIWSFYEMGLAAKGSYNQYMKYSYQSFYTYDVQLKNNFALSKRMQYWVSPRLFLKSEPAQTALAKRLERQFTEVPMGFSYKQSDRKELLLDFSYKKETLSQKDYNFLDNDRVEAYIYQKRYFLPETFYYFGFRLGSNNYPNGTKSPQSRDKYNSKRIEPGFGLEGRLTRYFKIRSYFGYTILQYTKDINYQNPVFMVELEETLSPRDLVLLGFSSTVEDSYYTNFLSTEKVYAGYGRFLGDQVLLSAKVEYGYINFSRPNRRDDQRIALTTDVEYSYSQNLKLSLNFLFDLLSSDGVNPDGPPDPIDPSTGYRNMRLTLSGKYLF